MRIAHNTGINSIQLCYTVVEPYIYDTWINEVSLYMSGLVHPSLARHTSQSLAVTHSLLARVQTKDNTVNRLNMSIGFIVIDR